MKNIVISSLRAAALIAALSLVAAVATAKDTTSSDRAMQLLAMTGTVPVMSAGPYVEVGTFRIQVSVKLGQPAAKLADGTWLYRNFAVVESDATGTLVVRFDHDRVSQLTLVSPKVETAMLAKNPQGKNLAAAR